MRTSNSGGGSAQSTDPVNKLGVKVQAALIGAGLSLAVASTYSLYCMEMYRYILHHPEIGEVLKGGKDAYDVYDGTRKAVVATGYMQKGAALRLTSATSGLRSYAAGGGATVLAVFVDHFGAFAKSQGIELNECSMAVVKVSLDVATAGGGAVTAVTGFGAVVAGIGVISTFKDSYSLGQACFNPK